jgi:glycosyltransferase involved in cell wall biosynthesis
MKLPSITILTCSYNTDLVLWRKMFRAIHEQQYPRSRISHIVMDGGSTNGSIEFARENGCDVIIRKDLAVRVMERMSIGIKRAKGDLILFLEPDNFMVGTQWLHQMIKPFIEQHDLVGTFSIYNGFDRDMPALTRYCALIGVNDPTVYYLDKSEKLPRFETEYHLGRIFKRTADYSLVRFSKSNLPTLGDNGHMVSRRILEKVNKRPENFFHTDAFAQLLTLGYDTYGVVKNEIIHYTGSNLLDFVRRRALYKQRHYDAHRAIRQYYVFDPHSTRDRIRLCLYIVYSITFIQPLLIAFRGFLTVPDPAWFLHPIVCFASVLSYTRSELAYVWKHTFRV